MKLLLSPESLNQLFRTARTPNGWSDTPVEEYLVHRLYDLLKWAPFLQYMPGTVRLGVQPRGEGSIGFGRFASKQTQDACRTSHRHH